MLSQDAIARLGSLLSESFPEFIMNDRDFQYEFFDFLARSSVSHVYEKLGSEIDHELAIEISCAIQNNIILVNEKEKN
jgi:hypothetical protein